MINLNIIDHSNKGCGYVDNPSFILDYQTKRMGLKKNNLWTIVENPFFIHRRPLVIDRLINKLSTPPQLVYSIAKATKKASKTGVIDHF